MLRTVVAIFLMLHGLVHIILALAPDPDADEAHFAAFFSRSWLTTNLSLPTSTANPIALILAIVAAIGFIAAGLGLLDILVPFAWWRTLAIISAVVSLLLLLAFWHRYLIIGVAIDILILAALIFTNWTPE